MKRPRFVPPDSSAGLPVPAGFERWNKALQGAFRRGMRAHLAGLPFSACPYYDRRKADGRLTWSRAFVAAWEDGHRWAERQAGGDPEPALFDLEPSK